MVWMWRKRRARIRDPREELPTARVLVECHDETAAASTVLAGVDGIGADELLLRHVVIVDAERVAELVERCAVDGYVRAPALGSDPAALEGRVAVALARLQKVDAQTVAQERALLSSMTTRLGGAFGSWAVLAPAAVATVAE